MSAITDLMQAATEARADYDAATAAYDAARSSQQQYAFEVDMWDLAHSDEDRKADIEMSPPPSDEEVAALEKAATEAESHSDLAFSKVRQALDSAEAAEQPSAGDALVKPHRFGLTPARQR